MVLIAILSLIAGCSIAAPATTITSTPTKITTPSTQPSPLPSPSSVFLPTFTPSSFKSSTATNNTIEFGPRTLTNNVWGAPPGEILNSGVYLNQDSNSFGWYWRRKDPKILPGNSLVYPIYPSVRIGGSPSVASNSPYFPIKTTDIDSLRFDVDYDYPTLPTGAYNLAYELLFSDTNQPTPNLIPRAEVMIWIHTTFGQPQNTYQGDFFDGNNTYHLYSWVRSDGRLYASFNMDGQPQFQAHHTVDAKKLLSYLVIDPTWYLLGVEFGSEIVNGSGNLEVSKLNINLNGNLP
jgi:hypothetical protein